MQNYNANEFTKSIYSLEKWIENNGWKGYDPYDIKGLKIFTFLKKNKYTDFGSDFLLNLFPNSSRMLFQIQPEINAKAMALFSRAYFNLYNKFGDTSYFNKAICYLNWLEQNPSRGYSGFCWGYPFDWQTRVYIPKETPSGVVTSIAAHAFLDAYEYTGNSKYLDIADSCCKFILNNLNIDTVKEDEICFSYTPVDNFHVHNANLFAASTLLRTYSYKQNMIYKEKGIYAINFSVRRQNEDGSWYYWAPPDKLMYVIDNYHTGFVLECLNIGRRILGDEFVYNDSLEKGMNFYIKHLFLENGTPKFRYDSTYPVDIHSSAQAIITLNELSELDSQYVNFAEKIARWTIKNFQDKSGYFYYRLYKNHVDKMAYVRWGQAWMFRGLSYLV